MTDEEVRRRNLNDRLESVMLDAERWQLAAFDAGEPEEALRWFNIAGGVRNAQRTLEENHA